MPKTNESRRPILVVRNCPTTYQTGSPGLDIGYVPAGPDAFFRWSGQFGPQQLTFYWPGGPVEVVVVVVVYGNSFLSRKFGFEVGTS